MRMPSLFRSPLRRISLCTATVVFIAALAACGRSETPNNTSAPNENVATVAAKPAAPIKVEGFGLVSAGLDEDNENDRPSILLRFSEKLAGAQKFDELIQLTGPKGATVSGSWALDDDGMRLRFPFLDANKNYKLHIKTELSSADGKALKGSVDQEVFTGPMQPAVGFASQGSVLPARDTQGLPVVSINVSEVDVEFFHVRDKSLSTFFATYQRAGQHGSWELSRLSKIADSVYSNRYVLDGKPDQRALNYLPTQNISEIAQPGLYFAVMRRAGQFDGTYQTSFFFVSDIGLHTRVHADKLWVHAASLKTGEPLRGVELHVLDKAGNSVAGSELQTDADGNSEFIYKLKADQVLVAKSGTDVSLLPFNQPALDLSDFAVSGRRQDWYEVFAWSGRDLYRPGENVRISALLRDYDGKPIKPQPLLATLKQPDGRVFATVTLQAKELGYFEFNRIIPEDAPTGRWQLEFRVDPAAKETDHRYNFRVEDFLPERLKLDLSSSKARLAPGQTLPLSVEAAYLYGAPAAGNRFTAKLLLSADQHPVDTHKDFFFGDPTIELPKEAQDSIDSELDAQGKLSQEIKLLTDAKATAPIAALISGSVYESGGRTVTRTLKRTIWPADSLIGVRPLFDDKDGANSNSQAGFEIIRSNAAGDMLASEKLHAVLKRDRREFHWTYDRDGGWKFDFTQHWEDAIEHDFTIEAGKAAQLQMKVDWGDYRLEISDPQTGLTTRYPFIAGWSWSDQNRGKEARPDKVKVTLDKERYQTGDTLKVTITPPQAGPGLLLVESDHLLFSRNIDAKPGATFEIPVSKEWERHDVYVSAIVFRPGSAAEHTTPNRAVGVAHVEMDRRARTIAASVSAIDTMRPDQDLEVTVKAAALAGKPAYVTLSAVDVGILNITRFSLPDAVAYFFAQRALGVDAYDLYGRVIESFEGGRAHLRYGGDAMLSALPQARRPTAKVLTVDLFNGPVLLDAKGEAKLKLHVPEFNGSLRVAAMVYGDEHYGSAQTETIVRAPLVVEVSTPRVMAPGDSATLTVDLQNFSGSTREFTVQVSADKPLALDHGIRKITLADKAKTSVSFPLKSLDGFGIGHFRVLAQSGEIKIDRPFEIALRPAYPSVRHSTPRVLAAGESIGIGADAISGLQGESVITRLSLGTLPPLPFGSAVEQLFKYPYGCLEQTTSKAFPLIWLDAATAQKLSIKPMDADKRQRQIDEAFSRLSSFQLQNGNFSMWGGDSEGNEQLTPYVAEFLLDARDTGFKIPETTLQKALSRINDDLLAGGHHFYAYQQPEHLRFANEAYSAYVLARVQRAPLGTLRAIFDNEREKSLTPLPLVHLGIALTLQGDKPRGEKAIAEAYAKVWKPRPDYLGDYGSELRDQALMLALLHEHGMSKPEYDASMIKLAQDYTARKHDGWNHLSTQEMVALFRLGRQLLLSDIPTFSGKLTIGGTSSEIPADKLWSQVFGGDEIRSGISIALSGNAKSIYAMQDVVGFPSKAPAMDDSKVAITRAWFTPTGEPITDATLTEGQTVVVAITLEAKESMPDAMLVDLLPGGLEIENLNLTDAKQWGEVVINDVKLSERGNAAEIVHEEFRDDRYVAAVKLEPGQKAQLFYLLRAVSPGTYAVPPTLVEDMYRPQLRGIGASKPAVIKVVEPQ